jgi:hypothetical protein
MRYTIPNRDMLKLLASATAPAYVCFLFDWNTSVLCLLCPAVYEGILLMMFTFGEPWKKALPRALGVILLYAPMLGMFAWRWGHFGL